MRRLAVGNLPLHGGRRARPQRSVQGHHAGVASDRAVSDDQVAAVEAGLTLRIAVVAPSYLALPGLVVGTTHVATIQRRLATHLAAMYPLKEVSLPLGLLNLQ